MNICIIGTGYVGLPTGIGFATLDNNVICVDTNKEKIEKLKNGKSSLFEKDLDRLLNLAIEANKIKFTTSLKEGLIDADIVIVAVGTPTEKNSNSADLSFIFKVAEQIKDLLPIFNKKLVIAIKSTVPVGTGEKFEKIINSKKVTVISLPEFLREGFAVEDFFNPDRIVCGTDDNYSQNLIKNLYSNKCFDKVNKVFVDRKSAELIKYASNGFLAMKIHYINEIANLCEATGANIDNVALGMGLDNRIGNKFLKASIGFGGSCFPKDTLALREIAKNNKIHLSLINATIEGNYDRINNMAERILKQIDRTKPISILGLAFKNDTDDCRKSPSIDIIKVLLKNNIEIKVYDPKAMNLARKILQDKVEYALNEYDAVQDTNACVILTEWECFKDIDFYRIYDRMIGKNKQILDFRNILDGKKLKHIGFNYVSIGNHQ